MSDVIRDMKAGSSGWQTRVFPELENSSWQRGYAAFTVSASMVEQVRRYIANQPVHHRKHTSQDELIKMLRANEIDFDEKYLFR